MHAFPAVSILAPTQRRRPGNLEDPKHLRALLAQAKDRLASALGEGDAAPIVERLEAALDQTDLEHPDEGIAVFATKDDARALKLPFPVRERVVIDETFATRDLVLGLERSHRYRALVLSEKPSRLLEGTGDELIEVREGSFPVVVEGAHGEPLASGGYPVRTSRADEQLRQFFRQVDRALGDVAAHDARPVIAVGVERDIAYFDEVTEHGELIVGRVLGNHAFASPRELAALTWPRMQEYLASRRDAAITQLVDAIGARRAAVGLEAVWKRAQEGRGHLLLVEEDYSELPSRVRDEELEPSAEEDAPGVIADAVDEVIETVLVKRGKVIFVEPYALGEHGPIAMILRW